MKVIWKNDIGCTIEEYYADNMLEVTEIIKSIADDFISVGDIITIEDEE